MTHDRIPVPHSDDEELAEQERLRRLGEALRHAHAVVPTDLPADIAEALKRIAK